MKKEIFPYSARKLFGCSLQRAGLQVGGERLVLDPATLRESKTWTPAAEEHPVYLEHKFDTQKDQNLAHCFLLHLLPLLYAIFPNVRPEKLEHS